MEAHGLVAIARPSPNGSKKSKKADFKSWEFKMINESNDERRYDFIVVGAGAAGSVLAAELSASGAQVLVIESGGPDDAPTIADPSIWFYNVGNASRLFPRLHSLVQSLCKGSKP
jgi:hypothetical protein